MRCRSYAWRTSGKCYPGRTDPVLAGVDLAIGEGEPVGICGASGAGKTTLLNLLGCLDLATSGRYRLGGSCVDELTDQARDDLRAGWLGFVFQQFHLLAHLTVAENLELRWLYGSEPVPSDLDDRIAATLDAVGLGGFSHRMPEELSGGEMQRVALARALVRSPRVSSPTSRPGNLDEVSGEMVFRLLQQVALEGAAVVLVTHNPTLWARCSRRLRLADGRLHES